ncbi:putative phosphoribosyltransferase [Rosa chinensis]|uniref:Putative phosphoribosyltransferase n=1 Tax=Rosa chinensis TaxID=74649 RepID=A0A2P6RP08_ROSCH|nr:putative phosphoribosyltransferase [Rosa chinensis]
MVAAWLVRSKPLLGPEVVRYMLDADSYTWSMRKSKENWFRIVEMLAWLVKLAKWLDDIRRWRNSVTTILVHMLYLVLVWPKILAGMDLWLSQEDTVDPDELDEEFDTFSELL